MPVRDLATADACFHEHAVCHLPGDSPIAGTHLAWAAIGDDFLPKLSPLSNGTVHAELLDVAVGARFVVAVQRATVQRVGRRLDLAGCQLIPVLDGQIVEVRCHYCDQAALDAFWST